MAEMNERIWIGLVHVNPLPGNELEDGAVGAYVVALALAEDEEAYRVRVSAALEDRRFEVVDMEHIEPLAERAEVTRVPANVMELAEELGPERPVIFDAFRTYQGNE